MNIILTVVISIVVSLFAWILLAMLITTYTLLEDAIYERKYKKDLYKLLQSFEYKGGIVYDGYDAVGNYSFSNSLVDYFIHTEYTGVIEYHKQPDIFDKLIKDGILT